MTITIIRNASVFDGVNEELAHDSDVVVENGEIREVSKGRSKVTADLEIDAASRTLLPGLIDAHVHLMAVHLVASKNLNYPLTLMTAKALPRIRNMLERGFTTVRDVAGADFGIRQALAERLIVGPRAFVGGPGLTQTGGHGDHRRRTDSRLDRDR
ncbi:MAG TPA: amidohydrolase family protein, partial [Pseudorhizobium sp.]|nr:amidohydrolase family protein [Pseudorhizobium sp.]